MRTYGRTTDPLTGKKTWVEVATDVNGFDDLVWVTTLAQALQLNLGESPFYANYGIPAKESVVTQVFPDFYMARTQQQFAPRFAALLIARQNLPIPTYQVNVTTHQGVKLNAQIPIPT